MIKFLFYHHNPKKKQLELKQNINFKSVMQSFALYYFAYISFVLAIFSSVEKIVPEDYLALFFPLPIFILISIILVEIDNKRTVTNYKLQNEIKRIKDMYQVRKTTEDIFDNV